MQKHPNLETSNVDNERPIQAHFDRQLFARELTKSFSWLPHEDALALKSWALATYSNKHTQLILTAFATAQALKG